MNDLLQVVIEINLETLPLIDFNQFLHDVCAFLSCYQL